MEWIAAIVVGVAVGSLAYGLSARAPLVPCVLLGLLGAVLGDLVAGTLGLAAQGTPARWLVCAIAAGLVLGIVQALGGLRPLRSD
jgi:uncharacterized membrane protein YeaQ/YmgE (transglycosylase-associated protein family)